MKHSFVNLLCVVAFASVLGGNFPLRAIEVLSYHYDQANLGVNAAETQLTPADITTGTFQKLYSTPVDSKIFAQPLYVPGVMVTGGSYPGRHDLVIVGTQGDILYAMDAATGVIVWQTSFLLSGLPGATSITSVPSSDSQDIYNATPTIGILGTPVIDPATHLLYVLAKTKQIIDGQPGASFVNTMYKVDITNAAVSDAGAPLNIVGRNDYAVTTSTDDSVFTYRTDPDPAAAQDPFTNGTGDGYITVGGQNRVYFNALRSLHRSALVLVNGKIYACFASAVGVNPYHGWMLGFDKDSLAVSSVTNLSPNVERGGIWAAGGHPAVDSNGNIFLALGNGPFDGNVANGINAQGYPAQGDYGDCLVKLVPDATTSAGNQNVNGWGIKVADYFSPSNNKALENGDLDLGCGGILLLPDSFGTAAHPHLLVTAGKEGTIYLLDRDNLGKFASVDKSVQELLAPALLQCFDSPALFNSTLFYAAEADHGKAFTIANGAIGTAPIQTPDAFQLRGATPTISANGSTHGVVWMISSDYKPNSLAQLRAYSAANFSTEIWTSDLAANSRDALGVGVKFSVPTVADGRVFVGALSSLVAYGLNPGVAVITSDPPPANATVGSAYTSTFTAAGTASPTFALTSGTLPPGLALANGVLSGTPTTPGAYTATVTAMGNGLSSNAQTFTITVPSTTLVALTNPVGYWQFNEGTGTTTADASGSGVNGTLFSNPTWGSGLFGFALNYNGTSSYVTLSNASATGVLKPALPITISAWIKSSKTAGTQDIFLSDSNSAVYAGCYLQTVGGVLWCGYGSGKGSGPAYRRSKTGTTVMKAGQWYQVTAVIQGPTTMNLYVNGVDDGGTYSGTGAAMEYTAFASKIGSAAGSSFYSGVVDDVRFYNRVLSPTEIGLLANGPVSNWRLDEGSGTVALDSGTAGITGTLVNNPAITTGWFGNALGFNGTSSYVTLNNASATSPLKPALPITLSAWIKPAKTAGTQDIFLSDSNTAVYAGCYLQTVNGVLWCGYGSATGSGPGFRRSKGGTTVMMPGQWYQVTAVIQGPTTMNLYVNGVDDGGTYSGTGAAMGYTTLPSKIGSGAGSAFYNGVVDDFRFYNRVLTPAEVKTLDGAASGPIPPE